MRASPQRIRRRVPVRASVACAALAACALVNGCVAPHIVVPLAADAVPAQPLAILPVAASDVRIAGSEKPAFNELALSPETKNHAETRRVTNEVLDALVRNRARAIFGPTQTAARLGPDAVTRVGVYLDDPGPPDESWKQAGLAEIASQLDGRSLIRVRVRLTYGSSRDSRNSKTATGSFGTYGVSWDAIVTVVMEAIEPTTGLVATRAEGNARYRGSRGVAGTTGVGNVVPPILIPYATGNAFNAAIDRAAREALMKLMPTASPESGGAR